MILAMLAETICIVLAQKQRLWPMGVNPKLVIQKCFYLSVLIE